MVHEKYTGRWAYHTLPKDPYACKHSLSHCTLADLPLCTDHHLHLPGACSLLVPGQFRTKKSSCCDQTLWLLVFYQNIESQSYDIVSLQSFSCLRAYELLQLMECNGWSPVDQTSNISIRAVMYIYVLFVFFMYYFSGTQEYICHVPSTCLHYQLR